MKKILLSLGTLVAVAAVVAGGTIAFYNDTETSSGNIFTAGSIDLKVEHLRQTYNGVDCETCSLNIWSSEDTTVIGGTGTYAGIYPTNAVELSTIHPNWLQSIPGSPAKWIWITDPALVADRTNGAEYTFQKKFNWNSGVEGIILDLALAADNGYKIVFNGVTIADQLGTEFNYGALVNTAVAEALMLPAVLNGENTLEITVKNKPNNSLNPAGLIFDLKIQRPEQECEEDSAFQQACQLWEETDLDGSQTFFNFGDIKPADEGTNLISLHVESNDAYICLFPNDIEDAENLRIEPEETAGDETPDQPDGELSQFIKVFMWNDDGDGEYEGEDVLVGPNVPLNQVDIEILALNLSSGGVDYIGLAWCVGEQSLNGNDIECSGNVSDIDQAQTDSVSAALTAYAVQQRNNENFDCESVLPELFDEQNSD